MRNILFNRHSSKLGLLGSLVAVVVVALVLALVPQKTNTKTLAENCVNPPTTPTLNHWPVTYDDETPRYVMTSQQLMLRYVLHPEAQSFHKMKLTGTMVCN